jgi:hypothetical protein
MRADVDAAVHAREARVSGVVETPARSAAGCCCRSPI